VEHWNWETIFYVHYRHISNHCDIIGLKIYRIRWKKTQNKGYYGVQGHRGRYQSKARMRLPISIWHPIPYRFGVIAAYFSNFWHFAFWATLWELRDNVRCSFLAHWKARSGLPISVNWTFFAMCYGWGATNENRSTIGDFAPTRLLWPKISGKRGRPHQSFLHG